MNINKGIYMDNENNVNVINSQIFDARIVQTVRNLKSMNSRNSEENKEENISFNNNRVLSKSNSDKLSNEQM